MEQFPIRVLLVDDHPTVRETLRQVLATYPNVELVREAGDGEEAIAKVEELQPTVVLMDICMTKMDGITATRLIKTNCRHIAVIGLSADSRDFNVYAMQKAGALKVVRKDGATGELYGALQAAKQVIT